MIPVSVALCLVCAILYALLDGIGFGAKKHFMAFVFLVIIISAIPSLARIVSSLLSIGERGNISRTLSAAMKAVGVGYICNLTKDFCSSLGEGAIASAVETVGRIEIFLIVLPFFEEVCSLALSLIK